MRKSILIGCIATLLIACGGTNKSNSKTVEASTEDTSVVNVYYFHGKQRCKTCIAVENLTKETVEKTFADNNEVRYIEVSTDDKTHAALVEKYQVTWNALIIAKGESHIDITKQAFANAVNNPDVLADLIKTEVNKRLGE